MINICEAKFSVDEYSITKKYKKELKNKLEVFREEVKPGKALHLTMITANGISHNEHYDIVTNEISGDDLFL